MFYLLDKCLKVKIHKILGRQTNVYIFTTMQILLFQAYCKHKVRLRLTQKNTMLIKNSARYFLLHQHVQIF